MKSKSKKQKSIDRKNAVDGEFKDVVVVNNLNDTERKKNLIADLVKESVQDEKNQKGSRKQSLIEMLTGEVIEQKEEKEQKEDAQEDPKASNQESAKNSSIKKEDSKKDSKKDLKKNTKKSKEKSNRSSLISMLAGEEPVKEDQTSPKNVSQSQNSLNQPLFNSKSEEHLSSLINELIPKNDLPLFLETDCCLQTD